MFVELPLRKFMVPIYDGGWQGSRLGVGHFTSLTLFISPIYKMQLDWVFSLPFRSKRVFSTK